jgi:hypothetical protein
VNPGMNRLSDIQLEIAQEQAEALGLAGRKLQDSIDRFNDAVDGELPSGAESGLIDEIAARAWALLVQRELIGFRHENLRWIRERFQIPDTVISRLRQPNS